MVPVPALPFPQHPDAVPYSVSSLLLGEEVLVIHAVAALVYLLELVIPMVVPQYLIESEL